MDLIELLERVRPGYAAECRYHSLMVDAYQGTGGFASTAVEPPAGFFGANAEVYDTIQSGWHNTDISYLDRFYREDDDKFDRRRRVAHYANYIAPLTDMKTDFMLSKEFTVEDRPPKLQTWREDVDGSGTTWDEVLPDLAVQAATVGYLPTLIDMPPAPLNPDGTQALMTRAVAEELGIRPVLVPLLPANLTDWQADRNGVFSWCKVRTDYREQLDPFGDVVQVTVYTIWYPDRYRKFEVRRTVRGDKHATELTPPDGMLHGFGEVPIAILRNKKPLNEPIRGLPMHAQETFEARRLFNVHSELDEHMRSQVFALLVLAMDNNQKVSDIITGNQNAIRLDKDSPNQHYYISPGGDIAGSYEKRSETLIQEIYRQGRVEFTRPEASRQAVSGIARKFEFAQTDKALGAYAKQVARFEEHVDWLVGKGLGISEDTLEKERITPPASFDVEDLQSDLQLAIDAITQLIVGPTAEKEMRSRIIDEMLPNLTKETRAVIDEELEKIASQQQQQAQIESEMDAAFEEGGETNGLPWRKDEEGRVIITSGGEDVTL